MKHALVSSEKGSACALHIATFLQLQFVLQTNKQANRLHWAEAFFRS